MGNDSFKVKKALNIEPQSAPNLSTDGDIGFNSSDSNLELYTGGSVKKVVTNSQAQTLTNKTLTAPTIDVVTLDGQASAPSNPSAGYYKVYVDDTTSKLQLLDSSGTVTTVGSGSGGAHNFITNGDAEAATTGWATYADAAGTSPVDGTGGSPTVTWTRSTSSPLTGLASFLFTKDAANRQGEGASYDFTINRADQAKVCRIDFDYEVASGTYADGDLTVWLYDVTNAQLIQPSASSILNAVGPQKKQPLSFQTNSNSTSYRLIIHVASTSASAYTVKFDSVSVTRESISQGTVTTDPVAYTPTFTGFGTPTNVSVVSWRDGAFLYVQGKFTAGTSTATEGRISLGFNGVNGNVTSADTTLLPTIKIAGDATRGDTPTAAAFYTLIEPSVGYVTFGQMSSGAVGLTKINGNTLAPTSERISFTAQIPILGWSSSQQLSSDADTRVVAASYGMSASSTSTAIAASDTLLDFDTKIEDSHGAVTTGASWKYTAPVPGLYKMRYSVTGTGITGDLAIIGSVYRNGAKYREQYREKGNTTSSRVPDFTFEFLVPLKAGEYFAPYIYSSTSNTIQKSVTYNWIDIERISGPAQIAASEQIFAKATSSTTTVGTSATVVINPTVVKNTHGAYNSSTGQFTCPAAGDYEIVVGWNSGSAVSSSSIGSGVLGYTRRNTALVSLISEFMYQQNTTSIFPHNYAKGTIPGCIVGDIIDFTLQRSSSISSFALDGNAQDCWIEFRRIGGVG